VIALIAMVVIWLIRKFVARRRNAGMPAYAGSAGSPTLNAGGTGYSQEPSFTAPPSGPYLAPHGNPLTTPDIAAAPAVPANFDAEAFVRNAKVYFVRLQAAWDVGNMEDIREFTTPEMFAEVKVDLASRGTEENQTDVVQLNAELLGETAGAAAEPFVEIWNLSKSTRTGEGWLLAGIQQVAQH
jgi:predicted lipid-binding transport protein (Tim44 family)